MGCNHHRGQQQRYWCTGASDGNILANSGDDGIEVYGSATGNAFLGNSIYNNGSMAIDLGGNNSTPTLNDFNDTDSGTNGLQNFPVLKTATTTNGKYDDHWQAQFKCEYHLPH